MKFPDPYTIAMRPPRGRIIFAGSQLVGTRRTQEDFFSNFNDECVVMADGASGKRAGDIASRFAVETAVWGYKHIRQRPYYWEEKQKLIERIFRSTNIALWQKHRETEFATGLAATLSVLIIGPYHFWVGTVGDSPVYLYRDGLIDVLTTQDTDDMRRLSRTIGSQRFGLVPHVRKDTFLPGDIVIMATDGVSDFVSEDTLRATCEMTGYTTQSVVSAVSHLLRSAEENGSDDNMTVCMIVKPRETDQ